MVAAPHHLTLDTTMPDRPSDETVLLQAPGNRLVYDADTLAELEEVFGRSHLMDLLSRLKVEIGTRLNGPASDRAALGHDAHTLLSVSGSLGFVDLSYRCSEIERACLRGEDLAAPLHAARAAAAGAIRAISDMEARA